MKPSSAALLFGATLGIFLYECRELQPQLDDSYISYRYAMNFVEGNGLVFNPGERVEGYSNLLWTLLISLGLVIGIDAEVSGHVLGVVTGALTLVATFIYARAGAAESDHSWVAALAPLVVLACPGFPYLVTSGMETPLFLATTTGALAAFAYGRIGLATALAVAATLTRPDGVLVAAVVFGLHVLAAPRDGKRWIPGLAYVAVVLAHTAFRMSYYGDPLPNTFYAKVGGIPISAGIYAVAFYIGAGLGPLLLPGAFAALKLREMRPGALFVCVVFAYVIAIGGGGLLFSRFMIPALPVCAALGARGAMQALDSRREAGARLAGPLALACVIASGLWYLYSGIWGLAAVAAGAAISLIGWQHAARPKLAVASALLIAAVIAALSLGASPGLGDPMHPLSSAARNVGISAKRGLDRQLLFRHKQDAEKILARGPSVRLVAAAGIGALGYYSRLPILDYLGLVDPVVARSDEIVEGAAVAGMGHQRSAAAYVLGRKPDIIKIGKKGNDRGASMLPAVLAIWSHPDLDRYYVWDESLGGYQRRRGQSFD